MTKKQRTLEIIERLKKEYPDAACTLDYDQAWKLLVSVRLAAQCTDARVNVVVEGLFEKYPSVEALAAADVEDIEAIVRPCGLGKSKARDISACMKMLRDEYDGKVPDDFNALLTSGCGKKECEPHYGGCLWKTGDRDRHPLHSPDQQDGSGGRNQGTEESRDGTVEAGSTGRGKRFLSSAGDAWKRDLHGKNQTVL